MDLSHRVLDDFSQMQREAPGMAFHAANVLADAIRRAAPVKTGFMRDHVVVTPTPEGAIIESEAVYSSVQDRRSGWFSDTIARMEGQVSAIIYGHK